MKKIYFDTTNENKLREDKNILKMDVESVPLDIDEIQSIDTEEVAVKKAEAYYNALSKPILIEDVAFTFNALNGLPGTYIKDFLKALGNQGMIDLLKGRRDRGAVAIATLVYFDGEPHVFPGEVTGKIAEKIRGESGFGWDQIFIPDGDSRSFAEMGEAEKAKYSHRAKSLAKFKAWLDKN